MYNLQTYIQHVLRLVEGRGAFTTLTSAAHNESLLFDAINTAQTDLFIQMGVCVGTATIALVSGTTEYDLPGDMAGRTVLDVDVIKTGESYVWEPDRTVAARRHAGSRGWYITVDTRKLRVPTTTGDATAYIYYEKIPAQMSMIYRSPATIVATATRGSDSIAVTLPEGVTMPTDIVAGDDIGLIPTTDSGGRTLTNAPPQIWSRIETVGVSTITIASVYPGKTISSARFITAQVGDLEKSCPGRLGFAIPEYAVGELCKNMGPNVGEVAWNAAMAMQSKALQRAIEARSPITGMALNSHEGESAAWAFL